MNRREFSRTSLAALLLPKYQIIKGLTVPERLPAPEDVRLQSLAAFRRFEQVWHFNDFWKRGNTFDACLTFAAALNDKWHDDPDVIAIQKSISTMLEENYRYFTSIEPAQMWADDFGWWGLMAINAAKHLKRTGNGELAEKYIELSIHSCWEQERNHAFDFSDQAKPVPHGCSNGDASGKNKGAKNTVTNVLFFLLSCRLYKLAVEEGLPGKEGFLEMAYRQWCWFDSWFNLPQYGYLQQVMTGGTLVHERPVAFFEGSGYAEKSHPTWEKGWLWTGDQGMLLAALHDMYSIKEDISDWALKNKRLPRFDVSTFGLEIKKRSLSLQLGIRNALMDDKDLIVREAPFIASFGPEFGNDYLAGRGILMRYLGRVGKRGANGFNKNLAATASAIWNARNKENDQFTPEFTDPDNDRRYVERYRSLTGYGDGVYKWQIEGMNETQKNGVCQSIGLDALGAVLNCCL